MFKNLSFAFIKELGEDSVLLNVNDEDIELQLTEENKQPIFDAVEQKIFVVPFDRKEKKILIEEKKLKDIFPEIDAEELKDASDDEKS